MKAEWPELSYTDAKDTYETLHLFTQIIGKIKLAKLPWINHSWHVALLVTTSGLTVTDLPDKNKNFRIDFDFIQHKLIIKTSDGDIRQIDLPEISVAGFYSRVLNALNQLDIEVKINTTPNEIENPIPFNKDKLHATYNPKHVENLHNALLKMNNVFTEFRSGFIGKCSPVHFFWGSFDLAVTRFSGREAPKHPGGVPHLPDRVAIEAYSHELSSAGFWPGSDTVPFAAFYSYAYPEPDDYRYSQILPTEAYYDNNLQEFILPYEVVQNAPNPSHKLLDFLQSTYDAAAESGKWDRKSLERKLVFG
jgi:hypothetical protein